MPSKIILWDTGWSTWDSNRCKLLIYPISMTRLHRGSNGLKSDICAYLLDTMPKLAIFNETEKQTKAKKNYTTFSQPHCSFNTSTHRKCSILTVHIGRSNSGNSWRCSHPLLVAIRETQSQPNHQSILELKQDSRVIVERRERHREIAFRAVSRVKQGSSCFL